MDKLKKFFSCVAVLCLTLVLLLGLTQLMMKKDSYTKHAEFFDQQAAYEVYFIGASHMMNGVLPMDLWEQYGIVSYNFAQAGHTLPASYWVMRLAIDQKLPEMVVVDPFSIEFYGKSSSNFGLMHISLDSFPLSTTKLNAINDILDDSSIDEEQNSGEPRGMANMLWHFTVFHERWNSLEKNDFKPEKSYTRGAIPVIGLTPGYMEKISPEEKQAVNTPGTDYLRKIIEECQIRGIKVILTFIPFPGSESDQMYANYVADIAAEYGVDYINLMQMDVVDYRIHMADEKNHLNTAGARKLSSWIGQYLVQNYGLGGHFNDETYTNWSEDLVHYTAIKDVDFCAQTELHKSLLLISGDSVDAEIVIKDPCIFNDPTLSVLLEDLGVKASATNQPLGAIDADICIRVTRNGNLVDCVGYNYVFDEQNGSIVQTECIR